MQLGCLQQTKWKYRQNLGAGYKIFDNMEDRKSNRDVAMWHNSFKENVTEITRVSKRLMAVKLVTPDEHNIKACTASGKRKNSLEITLKVP